MLRSLFSGVSGMKNNQVKMDVIANNIANVSTTAFKSGRVRFQDIFSQTIADASSPTANRGGINPRQIGLGMQVGGIDTIMNQGAPQPTGRPYDLAIDGDGFFIIKKPGENVYTRDGAFNLSEVAGAATTQFNIVNSDGYILQGYANTAAAGAAPVFDTNLSNIVINEEDGTGNKINSISIQADGTVSALYEGVDTPTVVGKVALARFTNPAGLKKLGGNNYETTSNSGQPELVQAGIDINSSIEQGTLEMSNVDLANEFTDMIITSRAFQANSRSITTSDEMLQELLNLKR
ncbi:MAG: flagellar hook-basal body complex protein [Clostridiales bacterium]|nr:flagellar hook-basal body complex protein [Clostridiales bacterium]HBM81500.1 flagellar basal body rod protein FlgG [Clostridiaceae bacterium]